MKRIVLLFLALTLAASTASASTIAELFPDPNVARYVRDQVGAITENSEVTPEQLDTVWLFGNFHGYGEIHDVTGISHLTGAEIIQLQSFFEEDVMLSSLPDELFDMSWVTSIELTSLHDLTVISPRIGEMVNLTRLVIEGCGITELPDEVCNLTNLTKLSVSGCPITELPENIGNLTNLTWLDISGTQITALPDSVANLTNLEYFSRSGTPL